jgi:hypothetical protein
VPSVSGLASFLPVPVGGAKLSCHGKTLLRISPGNENVVTCHGALYKREQKTLPSTRWPAALLTLSRQQDESRYTNFNK